MDVHSAHDGPRVLDPNSTPRSAGHLHASVQIYSILMLINQQETLRLALALELQDPGLKSGRERGVVEFPGESSGKKIDKTLRQILGEGKWTHRMEVEEGEGIARKSD